ncbi:MAG: hypothetical protein MZV70_42690 [Desulfobacterales bacterium]|nr:hypothetical protein [Desulfobacterales bacterium]
MAVCTYPDTHAALTLRAFAAGCHVFVEKPRGDDAWRRPKRSWPRRRGPGRKLVVGYILRHHPSWLKFIELARTLGTPLVMRMNLNQQSAGPQWATHRNLAEVHVADCRLRRALRRRDVPDDAVAPRAGQRDRRAGSTDDMLPRACTTTASCRSRSPTGRWAGTRPAGAR